MEKNVVKKGRAYDTSFEAQRGLIYKLACRGWGRLKQANVHIDFEDVMQEMSLAYVKAAAGYDPEYGITFSAYLGRSCWNEFNKFAERLIAEQVELRLVSVDAMDDKFELDGAGGSFYDMIDSGDQTPEDIMESIQEARLKTSKLNPTAIFIVQQLVKPSAPLVQHLKALQDHARHARDTIEGSNAHAPRDISINLIAKFFNIEKPRALKAKKLISQVYGVEIRGAA